MILIPRYRDLYSELAAPRSPRGRLVQADRNPP